MKWIEQNNSLFLSVSSHTDQTVYYKPANHNLKARENNGADIF